MFIPRGEIVHESLATSYVLVDALVADLSEGAFSGIVEIVLRDSDSFIVIANGEVSAVVERPRDQITNGAAITHTQTTVEELADRSGRERGRVSIYGYSLDTATAVAGRINAQPLYVGLSTEFTDLEKMITKLVRESDREWFIEIKTESGSAALIHMSDDECRIVGSTGYADSGRLDLADNAALGRLLYECNRDGGTFDVFFARRAETIDAQPERSPDAAMPDVPTAPISITNESQLASVQNIEPESPQHDELFDDSSEEFQHFTLEDSVSPSFASEEQREWPADVPASVQSDNGDDGYAATEPGFAPTAEVLSPVIAADLMEHQPQKLSFVTDQLAPAADAEAMNETKRLMGEIAKALEEAAKSIGPPDSFSMSLRAGQLKIADRFPFLDPFAGEFEYLGGEIVFVGEATAEEFVAGLTEALKLAAETVARSTAFGDRFRAYVNEDLRRLLDRERDEIERLGLERVIEGLTTF